MGSRKRNSSEQWRRYWTLVSDSSCERDSSTVVVSPLRGCCQGTQSRLRITKAELLFIWRQPHNQLLSCDSYCELVQM